jgi:hypothetical protein
MRAWSSAPLGSRRSCASRSGLIEVTRSIAVPARSRATASPSHPRLSCAISAKASVATPPQHCPSRAASGKRTIHGAGSAGCASASRATRIASNSRCPPPMVP